MSRWIRVHQGLLSALARLTFASLKEAWYPVDRAGRPDLRYYRDDVGHYVRMYEAYLSASRAGRQAGARSFALRTHAQWGLIARGAEAAPYAVSLLRATEASAREDGASILAALGGDDAAVDALLAALRAEPDVQARDALVAALGHSRSRRAIPVLAALVEQEDTDDDTRWTAVESLGRIARQRFLAQADPVAAACAWLRSQAAGA